MKYIVLKFLFLVILFCINPIKSQESKHELTLKIDNDAFLYKNLDRYYTSGGYLGYKWTNQNRKNSVKSIAILYRMYTPKSTIFKDIIDYDRPYAGTLSGIYQIENSKIKGDLMYSIEIGILGPASGVGFTQKSWHESFGYQFPLGWENQINNSPIINIKLKKSYNIINLKHIYFQSQSEVNIGTLFNNTNHGVSLNCGLLRNQRNKISKAYFFLTPILEYNFYNSTIEGNFIGSRSIHTEEQTKIIFRNQIGFNIVWNKIGVSSILHYNTKETKESLDHSFLSILLSKSF